MQKENEQVLFNLRLKNNNSISVEMSNEIYHPILKVYMA